MALLGPLLGVDSVVFNHANLKVWHSTVAYCYIFRGDFHQTTFMD